MPVKKKFMLDRLKMPAKHPFSNKVLTVFSFVLTVQNGCHLNNGARNHKFYDSHFYFELLTRTIYILKYLVLVISDI